MAHGTPAIVHNAGGSPEIIDQTGGGMVFDDFAELPELLHQLILDDERHRYSQAALAGYQRYYTIDTHLEHYFRTLDRISDERAHS